MPARRPFAVAWGTPHEGGDFRRPSAPAAVTALAERLPSETVMGISLSAVNNASAPGRGAVAVREASFVELARWDELIRGFPNHRVVHTLAWVRSLEACGKGRPLYLVFEQSGEVVGCLPGLLVNVGPFRLFGSPLPGWQTMGMGPAFDTTRVSTHALLTALLPFLEQRYAVQHVELVSADLDQAEMASAGFRGEPVYTFRAGLYPGDDARVLKAMKESARRNIRRAVKLGLVAVFEDDEAFVDEHYAQIREAFLRGGNTVPFNRTRVLEYFRHMRRAGTLLAISVYLPDRRTNIATAMFTCDGKELLLWTWAHRDRYRWYRPTELMTWTVMQRAMAAGCEVVDFMGRGDFKAKLGAELDGTRYRWRRSRYGWLGSLRNLAERGYRRQQRLRGRVGRLMWKWSRPPAPERGDPSRIEP